MAKITEVRRPLRYYIFVISANKKGKYKITADYIAARNIRQAVIFRKMLLVIGKPVAVEIHDLDIRAIQWIHEMELVARVGITQPRFKKVGEYSQDDIRKLFKL